METYPVTSNAYQLFHDGALAFADAEQAGIRIDTEYCQRMKKRLTRRIQRIEKQFLESKLGRHWQHIYGAKTKLTSGQQLSNLLYKHMKLQAVKQTVGGDQGSTDDEALRALEIPELNLLLDMRKLLKVRDTYLGAYEREQVNGFIHPFFQLHLVRTYRSSSDSPNFQNIPKRDKEAMRLCRDALLPRIGHQFAALDFSGIEVRISACYHKDEKFIYDVVHGDMHRDMAIELYMLKGLDKHHDGEKNLRQGAKNAFVFPEFYGDYWGNCAPNLLKWAEKAYLQDDTPALVHLQDLGKVKLNKDGTVKSYQVFAKHVERVEDDFWNKRYKTYTEWKDKNWSDYQQHGYIDLLTGFRCGGIMNKKEVGNYPIQGTAFHCLLWTFIQAHRAMDKIYSSRLVMQVHDELVADCIPEETEEIIRMINQIGTNDIRNEWPWIILPLEMEAEVAPVNGSLAEKEFFPLT